MDEYSMVTPTPEHRPSSPRPSLRLIQGFTPERLAAARSGIMSEDEQAAQQETLEYLRLYRSTVQEDGFDDEPKEAA